MRTAEITPDAGALRPDPVVQDWPAIFGWLAEHAGLVADVDVPPRQFAGGLANLNYLLLVGGEWVVFRRPPGGTLAHGASDMAREARVLAALNPVFSLAPRQIAFCNDPDVIGVPFQLLEWRPGGAIGSQLPDDMGATDAAWLINALLGALAQLHAIPVASAGLGHLGRPSGFAERQLRGWTQRADAAFAGDVPASLKSLLARLENSLPAEQPVSVLHMDAKFDNLLVDPHGQRATALIDWDMGTLGPPAFDLALLLSYWIVPTDPAGTHALQAVLSLLPGWPDRQFVADSYARKAGRRPPDLEWYLGLARLRLATAWMQLYRLWQRGDLQGRHYAGFAAISAAILAQALDQFGEI